MVVFVTRTSPAILFSISRGGSSHLPFLFYFPRCFPSACVEMHYVAKHARYPFKALYYQEGLLQGPHASLETVGLPKRPYGTLGGLADSLETRAILIRL